jgi:hypothetical protein
VWTVSGPHPLVGELWCISRTHVQAVTADIYRTIQVLHRPLTLLLHGCERLQLVTLLRYCSLQEDKTGNVLVTLYWGAFMLVLVGFVVFGSALEVAQFMYMGKPKAWGKCCNFGSVQKYLTSHKYRT